MAEADPSAPAGAPEGRQRTIKTTLESVCSDRVVREAVEEPGTVAEQSGKAASGLGSGA